jgi:hypothetical protein
MKHRRQRPIEESSAEDSDLGTVFRPRQVPVQPFFDTTEDKESKSEESSPRKFEKRNPRTGESTKKTSAVRFIDQEAVHESGDSDEETEEESDESDSSLKEFISDDEYFEPDDSPGDADTDNSDATARPEDSFSSRSVTRRMQAVEGEDCPFDVVESKDVAREMRMEADELEDWQTIKEGRSIVETGVAFPQDADLDTWYTNPRTKQFSRLKRST